MKTAHEAISVIRAEIERRMKGWHAERFCDEMNFGGEGVGFLAFLDTLEADEQPKRTINFMARLKGDLPLGTRTMWHEAEEKDSFCKENCKGFQETGKCFADGECKAKRQAEEEGIPDEVAHFAFYRYNDDPQSLYLANVFVKENERGNGYGNNILTMAEAAASSIGAWCIILKAKKGSDAVNWYARHGFTEIEDVGEFVWMRKNISDEKYVGVENVQIRKMED